MTLLEYIRLPHRWRWGYCDCTLFVGDWVVAATGRDSGEGLRGTYHSAEEANGIVDAAGGMKAFVASRLEPLGFTRTQEPLDGDIGVVRVMTGFDMDGARVKEIPAIRFGPLWAVLSARGPMVKKLDFTGMAWRIA